VNEANTDAAGLLPDDPNEWTLRLRSAERIREASRERLNQRLGRSHALIVVTEGRVRLALERRQTELNQGSVYWCAPETTFGFEACDSAFELYLFHFDVYRLRQAEDGVDASAERVRSVPPGRRLFAAASDRLPALCADIWRHWEGNERMGIFRSQLDFQELMYDLLSGLLPNPDNSSEGLEVALQYMEEHYAEPWTIERLARVAGVSPKYFVDLFKKRYGVSAMERLTAIRLSRAKQLMEQPALKLRDIAHRVGYADEFYFSRKFKKEIGVSPTDYRKRRRLRLAAYSQELLGMLLPLNVLPFAAPLHPKWTAYYYRVLRDDIPVHLNANRYRRSWRTDAELLREASVDLILAPDNLDGEERRALEELAPVRYCGAEGESWREQFEAIARLTGEAWQAGQWLAQYDRLVLEGRRRVQANAGDESIAIVRMSGRRMSLHCNRGMREVLFEGLGLKSAYRSDRATYDVPVTPEELEALRPGRLLLMIRQESETLEAWRRLQNEPRWQAIEAVRTGRVGLLASDPWREYSAHALLRMLQQAVQLLTEENP
jgi:AraC-like DNA-binding protein